MSMQWAQTLKDEISAYEIIINLVAYNMLH